MSLSIATYPDNTQLTTTAQVKSELGIETTTDDTLISTLIDHVSDQIDVFVNRPLARAQYTETLMSWATTRMVLSRLPVVELNAVSFDGSAETVTDFTIDSAESGFVYYENGFSTQSSPVEWSFTYKAGYLLPGDDVSSSSISAEASTDSYTHEGAGFPSVLAAGDTFVAAGFSNSGNNGRKTVVSATTSNIVVSESLTNETTGASVTMAFRDLPEAIERAAIDMTKQAYQSRKTDSTLDTLTVGPVSTKWATGSGSSGGSQGIPPQLSRYRINMIG